MSFGRFKDFSKYLCCCFNRKRGKVKREAVLKKIILSLILTVGISGFIFTPAYPYNINGFLDDWGVYPSINDFSANGGLDIDSMVEDNANGTVAWPTVGPGLSYYNIFDAEALYFDNDLENIYVAIVTGLPQGGFNPPGNPVNGNYSYVFLPGDIAIDVNLGNAFQYEYGLKISNSHLYQVSAWSGVAPGYFTSANPWAIASGSDNGLVEFVYSGPQIPNSGARYVNGNLVNAHYVLEAKIPLWKLGLPNADPGINPYNIKVHWTMDCGNDLLEKIVDVNPVPEPASLSLLGIGLLGLLGLKRKRVNS